MTVTVTARSVERVEKHVERVETCRTHTWHSMTSNSRK